MYDFGACNRQGVDINRADMKRGDYVDVKFNTQPNGKVDDTAGIYLNPVAIRLLGYGDPISSGVPASAAFSGHSAGALPPGASEVPTAGGAVPPAQGQPPAATGMPGATAAPPAPGNPPMAQSAPAQMPAAGAATGAAPAGAPDGTAYPTSAHPNILQQQGGQAAQGGMPGATAPAPAPAAAGGGMPGI